MTNDLGPIDVPVNVREVMPRGCTVTVNASLTGTWRFTACAWLVRLALWVVGTTDVRFAFGDPAE